MNLFVESVEAEHLAGETEAHDLSAAVRCRDQQLHRSRANGVDGVKVIALPEQAVATLQHPPALNQRFELFELIMRQPLR